MSKENNLTDFLTSLADKLRAKLGTAEAINPQDFDGKVDEVFAAGEKAEYDRFWDEYQDYGDRTNYQAAFSGNGWIDSNFNPKYKNLSVSTLYQAFSYSNITDIKSKINLDTSSAESIAYSFSESHIKEIGEISIVSSLTSGKVASAFSSPFIEKIDKLIVNENNIFNSNMFQGAFALKEITIEGIIGQNGFDVHQSTKLSKNSIISIINALSLSSTASGLTVTFSKKAVDNDFTDNDNLFVPLNTDKALYLGKLKNQEGYVTSDYIDCAGFAYIALNQGGSYGWYSDKSEDAIVSSENKSDYNIFRCYQKPEGARYCRVTALTGAPVIACGYDNAVTSLNGSNSQEFKNLIASKNNWTIALV